MGDAGVGDATVTKLLLQYLKRKQFKRTESALRDEARAESLEDLAFRLDAEQDADLTRFILFHNPKEGPSSYDESYTQLKNWIRESLDLYKDDLMSILYPVFVHSYLDLISKDCAEEARLFLTKHKADHEELHSADIVQLSSVTHSQHVLQNSLTKVFRTSKYNTQMSAYAFELLVRFLQNAQFMLLLSIVNERINVEIREGTERGANADFGPFSCGALTGLSREQVQSLADAHQVLWGTFPSFHQSLEEMLDDLAEEGGVAAGRGTKKRKKADDKNAAPTPELDRVPLSDPTELAELQALTDAREAVKLSSTALPSACMYTFVNCKDTLNTVALTPRGTMLAAGFSDSSILLVDLEQKNLTAFNSELEPIPENRMWLRGHSGPVTALSWSADNRYLMSASEDATVRMWSMETRTNVVCYRGHGFPIWDVACSPLGTYFVTGSHDGTARLWATDHITPLRIFVGHLSDVDVVLFHPNSNYVATGSTDKSVRLWDIQTGECVRIFSGHRCPINALAFSPDGSLLASGDNDGTIIEWNIGSGALARSYSCHQGPVWSLSYAAEGELLASGSADHTVRLWDTRRQWADAAANGQKVSHPTNGLVKTYYTKSTPVYNVQFTPRNVILAAGSFHAGEVGGGSSATATTSTSQPVAHTGDAQDSGAGVGAMVIE